MPTQLCEAIRDAVKDAVGEAVRVSVRETLQGLIEEIARNSEVLHSLPQHPDNDSQARQSIWPLH